MVFFFYQGKGLESEEHEPFVLCLVASLGGIPVTRLLEGSNTSGVKQAVAGSIVDSDFVRASPHVYSIASKHLVLQVFPSTHQQTGFKHL